MSEFTITCPFCGFSRAVDRQKIPANTARVVCPRCRQGFALPQEEGVDPAPAAAGVAVADASSEPPPLPDPPAPVAAAQVSSPPRRIPFVFTGNAREYFGIWIVNTLLKIITVGIYSPWAKVRKRRYFYANTLLDKAHFDYLANPLALLKGWLIGATLFIVYSVGAQFSPTLSSVLGLLFFCAMPWLIVRSRLFNNRNSAHRNIRFNFSPAYREAYTVFTWLPMLTPFTLGGLAPYMVYRQKRFLMENNRFGRTPFAFDTGARDFYLVFLKAFGLLLLLGGLSFGFAATLMPAPGGRLAASTALLPMLAPFLLLAGYLFLGLYVYVRLTNLTWNGTSVGGNRFVSTLRVRHMSWIFASNAVAVALSAGLLVPWATVRLARYRLGNLAVETSDGLDLFRADNLGEVGAAGEEIGDIFGIDIGI
jgi:predicted Zn finger-like uncharacterized protein